MKLTREAKEILEDELHNTRGLDYDDIVEFAINDGLYYEHALLVLSNKITMETAKEMFEAENVIDDYDPSNEVPDDEIIAACSECVKIAEEANSGVAIPESKTNDDKCLN